MATEIVERLARAMRAAFQEAHPTENPCPWEAMDEDEREALFSAARDGLAAIRETTEAHIVAWERQGGVYRLRGRPDLAVIWRRMIDAALAD